MSKSRGNFLDPVDMVAALGRDGTRYTVLREVAFDRDSDVSWDSFVRRYNADLANDFGNLLNRSLSMTKRYRDGERSAPDRGLAGRDLGDDLRALRASSSRPACCTRRSRRCGGSSARPTSTSRPSSRGRWPRPPRTATTRRTPGSAACSAICSRPAASSPSRRRRSCPRPPLARRPSWASSTATATTATAARRSGAGGLGRACAGRQHRRCRALVPATRGGRGHGGKEEADGPRSDHPRRASPATTSSAPAVLFESCSAGRCESMPEFPDYEMFRVWPRGCRRRHRPARRDRARQAAHLRERRLASTTRWPRSRSSAAASRSRRPRCRDGLVRRRRR